MSASLELNLSSMPPLGSLLGIEPVTLLTGIADDPSGALRVYLGPRYKGNYILIEDDESKEAFRRAWPPCAHIWVWPIPPADAFHCDREPVAT